MEKDSWDCYYQVLAGCYTNSHPPLLAVFWTFLNAVYPGSGLMLVWQLFLCWGAVYFLMQCFPKGSKVRYLCLALPFLPPILGNLIYILKDIHFTFGFLLIGSFVTYRFVRNAPIKLWEFFLLFALLFYALSVKYQARFVAPILILYLVFQLDFLKTKVARIGFSVFLSFLAIIGSDQLTKTIVQQKGDTHFWQYVKIFDLAGMSINADQMLVPEFLHKRKNITIQDLQSHYTRTWDPLIRNKTSPLRATKNDQERVALLKVWKKEVLAHPFAYLNHRSKIWFISMNGTIGKKQFRDQVVKRLGLPSKLSSLSNLFRMIYWFVFIPLFIILGVRMWNKSRYAVPLVAFNVMSFTLIAILFVFSLAGTSRYIYFSFVFLFFSMPFAWSCFKDWRQLRG